MLRYFSLACTTDSSGAGTVTGSLPEGGGMVLEIRQNSAAWNNGGSVDYTFTRDASYGGGTVVALTDKSGPFSVYCGGSVQSGGPSAVIPGIPVVGQLTMTVAQAGSVIGGTVHVLYRAG